MPIEEIYTAIRFEDLEALARFNAASSLFSANR